MNSLSFLSVVLIVTGAMASGALANVSPPPAPGPPPEPVKKPVKKPAATYPITLRAFPDVMSKSQIVIPRSMLTEVKKNAVKAKRADAGAGMSATVVAGLALSLAIGFGGFWLLRRRNGFGGTGARGLLLAACLVPAGFWAGTQLSANVAPIRPIPVQQPPLQVQMVVGDGPTIELKLKQEDFKRLVKEYKTNAGIE
ncbi:MAG: hypothetical protein R3236_00565 [Phycisphaeraceae bacterium]|nr:hypothetical protein [Phycisphaeraceae bacterium]